MGTTYLPIAHPQPSLDLSAPQDQWAVHGLLLWRSRKRLLWVMAATAVLSLGIAFAIPKRYESSTRIMPPDQGSSGAMMLAALTARAGGLGGLGSLAGGLFSGHTTTALFIDLLHSGTVSGHLIDRFHLQTVYRSRYRVDAAKHLARCTHITDDKKSGVITVTVRDADPARARDLAQAYLEELNRLVLQTSTSTARQERLFIEQRLTNVRSDLEKAQLDLSEFSSANGTVDIKEQTRAVVEAGARVEGELLVEQAQLESLRQTYGDANVRVREGAAAVATLQAQLQKMAGTSTETNADPATSQPHNKGALYPSLRQMPRLAVAYADLYRRVRVQETVYELLTQQYELARIEEAKDIPVVSVIDPAGIPEKKAFPPRLLVSLGLDTLTLFLCALALILRERWRGVAPEDARRLLASSVVASFRPTRKPSRADAEVA